TADQPELLFDYNGFGTTTTYGYFRIDAADVDYSGAQPALTHLSVSFEESIYFVDGERWLGTFNINFADAAARPEVVWERAGEGTDVVRSSISYTLPTNVENLTLTGSATIEARGNELANVRT